MTLTDVLDEDANIRHVAVVDIQRVDVDMATGEWTQGVAWHLN